MNTRLQVEHPVTELVTGLDLVRAATRDRRRRAAAASRRRTSPGAASAIECRIYAEDPVQQFLSFARQDHAPDASRSGPGIRLDSGVYEGWTVPMDYDPLLAKLAVWAGTREEAIGRMSRALGEYHVAGIRTNIGFFRRLMADPFFREGTARYRLHRGFPCTPRSGLRRSPTSKWSPRWCGAFHAKAQKPAAPSAPAVSRWRSDGMEQLLR